MQYIMSVCTEDLRMGRKRDNKKLKKGKLGDGITPGDLKGMKKEATAKQ